MTNDKEDTEIFPVPPARRRLTLDVIFKFSDIIALIFAFAVSIVIRANVPVATKVFAIVAAAVGAAGDDLSAETGQLRFMLVALRYLIPSIIALHFIYSLMGLYCGHRFIRRRLSFHKIICANIIMILAVVFVLYLRGNTWHPRWFFTFVFVANAVLCIVFRTALRIWSVNFLKNHAGWKTSAVIVGTASEAETICSIIETAHPYGTYIAKQIPTPPSGDVSGVREAVRSTNAKLLILADKEMKFGDIMKFLDLASREFNISTKVLSHKLSILGVRACESFDMVLGIPLVHFEPASASDKRAAWRIVSSRVFAFVLLLCLLPLFAVIALIIKLSSPGPVFFMQKRYGIDKRPFMMYKFRTMVADADSRQREYEKENESGDGLFKIKSDPRVIPVGKFLRRYSLDELPQIINVLKDDMRFVGPRPLPGRDVSHYYEAWHNYRHSGEPGLTCLWQISGRSEIGFEDMCILDIYYLHNRSWMLDLNIVLRTAGVVISGRGAY